MQSYSKQELESALPPIVSLISKCEKAQMKFQQGTSQHTLLKNRIAALRISLSLIEKELALQA